MQQESENEPMKVDIEKGKFLISLVIGLFAFGEIMSLFTESFNIGRIIIGSLLLFLVYEGYDWAKILWGILSAIGAIPGIFVVIFLILQPEASWGKGLAFALISISSFITMLILFFSQDARAFLEMRKRQPKYLSIKTQEYPRPVYQYKELSEKIQANFNGELPTYEITTVLPIQNSSDQIILLKYTESFKNVLRCRSDGFVIWQAELPTDLNDVYTNIEWKENQLLAFSRSCISVVLDVESGKILIPSNAT
jgi:hypothetical protein